tara:strand:- start:12 stop:512 length:501 start_codon:yes stop_codon:yes gene_type:complete
MIIKTKDFILRAAKKEDVDSLWENYNDEEVARNMTTMETEKEFKDEWKKGFGKEDRDSDRFVIEIDGMAVGKMTLRHIIPKLKGTVSSWIGKDHRGKGIMTKAKVLACDYWFKKYKLRRIDARTREYNKAAQRSLEKAGFKFEGVMKKNVLKNGRYYDDYLYARVR